MTTTAASPITFTARLESAFATAIGFCAEFCAGIRQGRDIEMNYARLAAKSTPDLARLGLTRSEISRAALRGNRYH